LSADYRVALHLDSYYDHDANSAHKELY